MPTFWVRQYKVRRKKGESRRADAEFELPKVSVIAKNVFDTGLVKQVVPIQGLCFAEETIRELAGCDVLFGCTDSYDGRDLLNRLATFYCIPFFVAKYVGRGDMEPLLDVIL